MFATIIFRGFRCKCKKTLLVAICTFSRAYEFFVNGQGRRQKGRVRRLGARLPFWSRGIPTIYIKFMREKVHGSGEEVPHIFYCNFNAASPQSPKIKEVIQNRITTFDSVNPFS